MASVWKMYRKKTAGGPPYHGSGLPPILPLASHSRMSWSRTSRTFGPRVYSSSSQTSELAWSAVTTYRVVVSLSRYVEERAFAYSARRIQPAALAHSRLVARMAA